MVLTASSLLTQDTPGHVDIGHPDHADTGHPRLTKKGLSSPAVVQVLLPHIQVLSVV